MLHLSEHQAYERITAARASRRFPVLLKMLGDGRLHLTGIGKLAPHLTEENCDGLLTRATHKTKRQIEVLLAELAPKPDVPAVIRKLPKRQAQPPRTPSPPQPAQLGPDRVAPVVPAQGSPPARTKAPAPPPVEPLGPARYKVQFTASGVLREKLERLQALLQEDLAEVIEAAVSEKLERLEAKRYGTVKKPRKTLEEADTAPRARGIPAPVRRVVWKRDGGRCTFRGRDGRRCPERHRLQFHHDNPFAQGGDRSADNIRLLCSQHNLHLAEKDYGKNAIAPYRRSADRVREPSPSLDLSAGIDRHSIGTRRFNSSNQLRTTVIC